MEKNKNTESEQPIENIPADGEGEQSKSPPSMKATTLEENILPEAEDNTTNDVWQMEKLQRKEIFLITWIL